MTNDIFKCMHSERCPFNSSCWRHLCPPDPHWQSYMDFKVPEKDTKECDGYWQVDPPKKTKKRGNK